MNHIPFLKPYALLLLLCVIALGMVACSSSDTQDPDPTTPDLPDDPEGEDPAEDSDPPAPTVISISGNVDSGLTDNNTGNTIYIYSGHVEADDYDGDSGDPIAQVDIQAVTNSCKWQYSVANLSAGAYTFAITANADNDTPQQDDPITFKATAQVTLNQQGMEHHFSAQRVLQVGLGKTYALPSDAIKQAQPGDVIEIDAGEYLNDATTIRTDQLTLRGVGGYAHMKATQLIPYSNGNDHENGMGIWVVKAHNVKIENIEFSGARVADENGAGIRAQGNNLSICNGYFHDNENGVLGGSGHVLIEYSHFKHNGLGEYGRTHNMYIADAEKFTLRHSYSHLAYIGHNVKTRAKQNIISYNRIMDEQDGQSSYAIDIPNGGLSYVVGNIIQQGPNGDNSIAISYGAEGLTGDRVHKFYMINNTTVNDRGNGTFVDINTNTEDAKLINNIFQGAGKLLNGTASQVSNWVTSDAHLLNDSQYDYHLTPQSTGAINKGNTPILDDDTTFIPAYQYIDPHARETRTTNGVLDIGAYEFISN